MGFKGVPHKPTLGLGEGFLPQLKDVVPTNTKNQSRLSQTYYLCETLSLTQSQTHTPTLITRFEPFHHQAIVPPWGTMPIITHITPFNDPPIVYSPQYEPKHSTSIPVYIDSYTVTPNRERLNRVRPQTARPLRKPVPGYGYRRGTYTEHDFQYISMLGVNGQRFQGEEREEGWSCKENY